MGARCVTRYGRVWTYVLPGTSGWFCGRGGELTGVLEADEGAVATGDGVFG